MASKTRKVASINERWGKLIFHRTLTTCLIREFAIILLFFIKIGSFFLIGLGRGHVDVGVGVLGLSWDMWLLLLISDKVWPFGGLDGKDLVPFLLIKEQVLGGHCRYAAARA